MAMEKLIPQQNLGNQKKSTKIPQGFLKAQDYSFDYDAVESDADVMSKQPNFQNIVKNLAAKYK